MPHNFLHNVPFTIQKLPFSPVFLGTSKECEQHSLLLLKSLGFQIATLNHALADPFLLHFFPHAHLALLPPVNLHFSTVALVSPRPPSLFHCYSNVLVATSCSSNPLPLDSLRTNHHPHCSMHRSATTCSEHSF